MSANTFSADQTTSTTWQRFSQTFTTGTLSNTPYYGLANGASGTNDNVYFWGFQLEPAAGPGVYVRTTAAAVAAGIGAVTDGVATSTTAGTVTPSSTDTFTNKTFDANGTGNALSNVDVADLAVGTDGELITWDSSGNPATVSTGQIYRGVIPFVAIQIFALILLAIFPEIITWLPNRIYGD